MGVVSDSQNLLGERNLSFVEELSSAEEEEMEDQIVSQAQPHTREKSPSLQNLRDLKARIKTLWHQEPQLRQELLSSLSSKLDELDLESRSHGFDDSVTVPQNIQT